MGGNDSSNLSMLARLKRTLAYYPLTMYFGIALLALSGLFLWLYLQFGFKFNLQNFIDWVRANQTPLLIGATGLLSMTLIGSAIAYRQVANLSKEDYVLWLQQRSTRTFFPFFVPLHDWFRLRFALYRWWHTKVIASTVHILVLLLFVGFSINTVTEQARMVTLLSPSAGCAGGMGMHDKNSWPYAIGFIRPAFAAGAINTFVVTGISSPTTVGTANSVTVEARDCDNLRKTDYVGTVHFVSSDGGATLPANYTFTLGDAGIHTFTNEVTFATAGTQSVTVNDTVDTTAVGSQTSITVNSAEAATLEVTGITDPVTAGTASSVTVTAKTAGGATATGYTGTITFTSSDGAATLPNNYTFLAGDNGTKTFAGGVTMKTVGERTVTATDTVTGSITGTQSAITVTPGSATTLTVGGIFSPVVAGTSRTVVVTAKDAYNNTATGYTGTVTFTSTDSAATLPNNYTFVGGDAGTRTFTNSVVLKTVGSRSVTATDTVTGSITGSQTSITVNPATAATLNVTGITDPVIAGTASNVTVTAKDAYDNTATGYTGTIAFTSSDPAATLPSNYTFVGGDAGTHTFAAGVTLKTAGERTVTATDTVTGSITGAQTAITVTPGPATALTVSGTTSPTVAGTAHSVIVTATDAYSNTATGYTGTITFTSSDPVATLPSNYTFVGGDAGTHTFASGVILKSAGTRSVTATDITGSVSGTQSNIIVTAASTSALAVSGIGSPITAGTVSTVVVAAKDAYGNTTPNYTGSVTFSSTDSQAVLPSNYTFIAGEAGNHIFSDGVRLKTAGTQSVTATDTGNSAITGTQPNIIVTAASATQIALTDIPSSTTAGSALSPTVTLKDQYNNIATNYIGEVVFESTDNQAVLPASYRFTGTDAGVKTFTSQLTLVTSGSRTVTVVDQDAAIESTITTTVQPGAIASYRLTTNSPQKVNVGWVEKITAYDAHNNFIGNASEVARVTETAIVTPSSDKTAKFYSSATYQTEVTSITLRNGEGNLFVKESAAGIVTLSVSDGSNSGSSGPITVVAAGADAEEVCPPLTPLSSTTEIRDAVSDECDPDGGSSSGGGSSSEGGSLGTPPDETPTEEGTTTFLQQVANFLAANEPILNSIRNVATVLAPIVALVTLAPVTGAITTTAVTNIAAGIPFINLSMVGMTQRRHRRRWGIVKNAHNQLPIGGVFVELFGYDDSKIAQTLTDQTGRYGFIVDTPGKYKIRVKNPLYQQYESVPLEIINPHADIVMADILLTPLGNWQEKTGEKITRLLKFLSLLNIIYWPVLVFGSVAALYVFGQQVTVLNAAVVGLYILLWSAKLLEYDYYRPFGLVVDKETDEPQAGVVVQLTAKEPGARTRVNSTITDKRGRFLFVVRPRHYHLVAAKEGYAPVEKDLIGSDINVTVKLEKARY